MVENRWETMDAARLSELATSPLICMARARMREIDAEVVAEQLRLVAIPAPTFQEETRAVFVEQRFRDLGLTEVHRDEVGNVLGRLPAGAEATEVGGAALITAHLDTVFPAECRPEPRRVGDRIYSPGITDNSRGLAVMLATARVMTESGLRPARPVWFIATVGEEGAGDLYGVKHLLRDAGNFAGAAAFLSIDGSGLRRVVHRALGSRRLRVEIEGPGGHSWSDFGNANPIHVAGSAIAALRDLILPPHPPTSITVARVGGGTTINAIPDLAWFEIDMRSEGRVELEKLERQARDAILRAARAENARRRRGTAEISVAVTTIGDRPSGFVGLDEPLLLAAMEATRLVGEEPQLVASSTDSNVAISLGIPAVTIGGGGDSGGIHTLDEWYDDRDGVKGLERALLLTIAAAGGVTADGAGQGPTGS
ncbi:MAG: M20/M25/M40 family metallo-hydrolase [Gemmatimonadetes bacterium]|nr:M20/M25/M40 family metallo-hydrolase [Gemmatimonadota bacterium]